MSCQRFSSMGCVCYPKREQLQLLLLLLPLLVQDKIHDYIFSSLTDEICGDRCSDNMVYGYDKPSKCTCGGSQLPKDKFCCIPSHTNCTGVGDVNCPNGTALNFHQPCEEECSISTDNYVAITSTYDKVDCSKKDSFFFSKVSSGTDEYKDFEEYCGAVTGDGKTCGSSTSSVSFKQCHIK